MAGDGVFGFNVTNAKLGSHRLCSCPMHPQIRRMAPGNCPICGMAPIPPALARTKTFSLLTPRSDIPDAHGSPNF
jgi:hypothetical protein